MKIIKTNNGSNSSNNGKHNGWDKNKDKGSKLKSNNGLHLGWYKRADQPNNPASDASYQITNYINDISLQNAQVIETSNKDGVYDRAYTNGLERISEDNLTMTDDMKYDPLYYVNDGKGNVTELTDGRGVTRDRYRYDPYGVPIPKATVGPNPVDFANSYRYNGEDTDIVTGLQYLRARYYEPTSGRFLTRDSYLGDVTEPLTLNRYAYAVNNPIMYSDPSGHRIMPLTASYDETDEQREYSLANQNYVVRQEAGDAPSVLQYGSNSDEVKDLQQKLLELGYSDVGKVDGDFGINTKKALTEFQNAKEISENEAAGRETLTALDAAISLKRQADQYALTEKNNPTTSSDTEQKIAERPAPPKVGCDGSAYIGNGAYDYKTGNVQGTNGTLQLTDEQIAALADAIANYSVQLTDNQIGHDWQNKFVPKGIFDKFTDWITGDSSAKNQYQQVIEAQYSDMYVTQQIVLSDLAWTFYDITRGAASLDRVNEIFEASSENYNTRVAGKTPEKQILLGSEWDDYFRSKYGNNNVTRDTKIKSIDDIIKNPEIIKDITPERLANLAQNQGWEVGPLGKGGKGGIPFSEGGGLSIRKMGESGDYIDSYIQYHPGNGHHGELPYFKVSSGSNGIQRFFIGGN